MSTSEAVKYDCVFEGQRFRTLDRSEYAEHIERSRAFRGEHGYPPPEPGRGSYRWLGPYEKCERCGVAVVGAEHHAADGTVTRKMVEPTRIRTLVDEWPTDGKIGLAAARIHVCVRR